MGDSLAVSSAGIGGGDPAVALGPVERVRRGERFEGHSLSGLQIGTVSCEVMAADVPVVSNLRP
jgi:hypothetical protein